jgi:hypothetical protein
MLGADFHSLNDQDRWPRFYSNAIIIFCLGGVLNGCKIERLFEIYYICIPLVYFAKNAILANGQFSRRCWC